MSKQTQQVANQLEARVEELTQVLTRANHQLQRRSIQLEASTRISRVISSDPDLRTLNKQVVKIIKTCFGLYHVSIFLIDNSGQWAVLDEAAGKASRKMKKDGYRLAVDGQSAIAWVCQNRKSYLSYPSELTNANNGQETAHFASRLLPKTRSEMALPMIANNRLVGVLDLQSVKVNAFDQDDLSTLQTLADQIASAIEKVQTHVQIVAEHDRVSLLHEISVALSTDLELDSITDIAVGLAEHLGATSGEIHLLADTGEIYFKSSYPERNNLDDIERKTLVHRILTEGLDAWGLKTGQSALVSDTNTDERWLPIEYEDPTLSTRSAICSPIIVGYDRLRGAISYVHPEPNRFDEQDLALLKDIASQITVALEKAAQLEDLQSSLDETHLTLDISRQLAGAQNLNEVYTVFVQGIMTTTGVERCVLHMCDELDANNVPQASQIVFIGDVDPGLKSQGEGYRFPLTNHPVLTEVASNQETLIIGDIKTDKRLTTDEREFLQKFGTRSLVVNPLVARGHVIGMIFIEYRTPHNFNERELALYRTLCNQATLAIENAYQIERTEMALAETQSLYRAGRVLAGAADLQEVLEEALFEFLYSLGLDQGGITLLTSDRKYGQLMVYVENGLLQDVAKLRFPISEDIPYQQILLSGQPFISSDVPNDSRLTGFQSFNLEAITTALLEAPMIVQGETIGWIGADALNEPRVFAQREIDLARAMADQIAITIQNRSLLEQTQRRAEQLKAVATVGESVSSLIDLNEVLNNTVNLIRDRFGFYHVSIFLVDEVREWAVVRASTGEVGKIMVERPHRLEVGGQSIVGFTTATGKPRIALDVGQDAVHFENPLLPDTRSEMALPLTALGTVIGALDVQSVEADAFSDEDVDTLQIMADQLAAAIQNARLFEQTQRRLMEQAMLYSIGTKIGATLNLQEATDSLVIETANALHVVECTLMLIEKGKNVYIISDYVDKNSSFRNNQGQRFVLDDSTLLSQILVTKEEIIFHTNDLPGDVNTQELEYLKIHRGTALVIVPVLLRNKVIAFLAVYDDKPGRRFSQEDISLLDSIALQAANAIENARLFESAYESQTFMKAIIDEIPDPIFIKDREHRWTIVNKAFEELLGLPEEKIIGHSDYDYLPKEQADWFWAQDTKMFETGQTQETEEPITGPEGNLRTLYTRKIPLTLTADDGKPDYLVGLINDITDRKQREAERERLIEETRRALERTQLLYRLSDALATATDQQTTAETVLGEYLRLLNLDQGMLTILNQTGNYHQAQALYSQGQPVKIDLIFPVDKDPIAQYMAKNPTPLIIDDVHSHPLTKDDQEITSQREAMLVIPLVTRGRVVGMISASATEKGHIFSQSDIEMGEAIADQLTVWLENRQLLEEAQYRSNLLETAAEVSKAASSILDVDQLINTSVNFIRDQFDFYYVGLFLVDQPRQWAVLRAGTGEAGHIQLEKGHRLKIGGGSMIGWCVQHRQARIALDVGEEAVHFQNPYLPDTHSEMALPLISRDEVIGALTVQSVERGAFSDEDITLLQTMADQLANAIANARLFAQTQKALSETETLYRVTQELLSADNEETVYKVAMDAIVQSGIDSSAIYTYIDDNGAEQLIEQKAIWTITGDPVFPNGTRFKSSEMVIEQLVPRHEPLLIEDVNNDPRLTEQVREVLISINIKSVLVLPLSTHQSRLGFLLIAYKTKNKTFTKQQMRFYNTIAQQMIVALANLRLLEASQRRAQREEIIREIAGKIRNSINVDDIMKTTVTELSKVLGASRGGITLNIDPSTAQTKIQAPNGESGNNK